MNSTTPDIITRLTAFASKKGSGDLWLKERNFPDFYMTVSTAAQTDCLFAYTDCPGCCSTPYLFLPLIEVLS